MAMTCSDEAAGVVMVWQRLATNVVHRSPWFEVRADDVVRPDGGHGTYTHVVAPGSVTVLAIQDDDHVVLTRQWIYTHGGTEWRLPGGAVDDADADPLAAARRELAEETGLRAEKWERLGQIHGADSLSNHVDHIFLATDLTQGEPDLGPGEADLRVRTLPFHHALDLVQQGMLPHAGSSHALLVMALRRTAQK
ncbi:NUDIX domain-containing protein [Lentzea nigeriaca]|uniref:NUDIX domain-containing protein n=1 Tax=Lentzea nigeriaca TaxID=1128665 RepID=UPI001EF92F48|nr:NUDIX hydrolase [Lentzea nigeriaca]MBM7856665.1 8-oxo-dGTP pyrophosphatase MutT (NUDIX family) [Lentzea nigeriaca]